MSDNCANRSALRLGFITLILLLTGCSDHIEKCVQAIIQFGEPYKDQKARERQEFEARLECLKASSGQKD